MIGGNSKVVQDVLPFFLVDGLPAIHRSLNERRECPLSRIVSLSDQAQDRARRE